jgi:hypothetical protein
MDGESWNRKQNCDAVDSRSKSSSQYSAYSKVRFWSQDDTVETLHEKAKIQYPQAGQRIRATPLTICTARELLQTSQEWFAMDLQGLYTESEQRQCLDYPFPIGK